MNLYKLRHMRGCNDIYQDQISIEEGTLKMRKVMGSYKDYGHDNVLWSEAFLNYIMILMELFGSTTPSLHLALHRFPQEVIDLSTVYEWQRGVLSLALDLHIHIVQSHPIDPARWEIPTKWQARFCNPLTVLGTQSANDSSKRKRPSSPVPSDQRKKDANDNTVFYHSFNKGICSCPNRHRKQIARLVMRKIMDQSLVPRSQPAEVVGLLKKNDGLVWEALR